jgi:hypothetical protein
MPENSRDQQPRQSTSDRYLKKDSLQALLEQLFPGQTEFNIRVFVSNSCIGRKAD